MVKKLLFVKSNIHIAIIMVCLFTSASLFAESPLLKNEQYIISASDNGSLNIISKDSNPQIFKPEFIVLYSEKDPEIALRPQRHGGGINYNVPTWYTGVSGEEEPMLLDTKNIPVGDGFDPRILAGDTTGRTADYFHAASIVKIAANLIKADKDQIVWASRDHPSFEMEAKIELTDDINEPLLSLEFYPKKEGFFSIGYCGAPEADTARVSEIWQPMIWQEKRFPAKSYITMSYHCPLPTALVCKDGLTLGVIADPQELPFQPLPLFKNAGFGVLVRNHQDKAQPMLFAPVLGGQGSKMAPGDTYRFKMRLLVYPQSLMESYKYIGRKMFKFHDRRHNALGPLNKTLENMIEYGMSPYSRFDEELKGCNYSTDVPGAVKNVSSLHPLSLALVTDDEEIYRKRAYPYVEYMLSREKFLFTTNPKVRGQGASIGLKGTCAPISELTALYLYSNKRTPVFLDMAKERAASTDLVSSTTYLGGNRLKSLLGLYHVTGNDIYLNAAIKSADASIKRRIDIKQSRFVDPDASGGFWFSLTPDWISYYLLYEETGEKRFLDAAWIGAQRYTQFMWLCPEIPDKEILVNKGGHAPLYWYMESQGKEAMPAKEEMVPAWRLSEIGLTPEGITTSHGHRGIFLAHYAPWMLNLYYKTGEKFLHDLARSAIIGRYTNFPGYHINTARTTVYEKPDYPLKEHMELSYNSFHYNHIWPHMALLLDYMVTETFIRSKEQIAFPGIYAEGYAYLQSKVYGNRPGNFYDEKNIWLWMPKNLIAVDNQELNYIAGRGNNKLYLAFSNQSDKPVTTKITLNPDLIPFGKEHKVRIWQQNEDMGFIKAENGEISLSVAKEGITAIAIENLDVRTRFQHHFTAGDALSQNSYTSLKTGNIQAMLLSMGDDFNTAYIYSQATFEEIKQVRLHYKDKGQWKKVNDDSFPYEFTVPLDQNENFEFFIESVALDGTVNKSKTKILYQ